MPKTATCPHGHEWELDSDGTQRASSCPVCGAAGVVAARSIEKTELDREIPGRGAPGIIAPDRHEIGVPVSGNGDPGPTVRLGAAQDSILPVPVGGVPGYELLGELGHGGMGVVYKARQVKLNRLVALKMVRPGRLANAQELARFRAEAEAVARLQHPNIVQIFEVGEAGGQPYFSLELVEGGSLARQLTGVPLPARPAAQLVEMLARAVHYAHQRGVVHRDLKPANILLVSGGVVSGVWSKGSTADHSPLTTHHSPLTPKITDFGLAKYVDTDAGQTETGMVVGTPSYMAPEQAWGKSRLRPVGPAVDVYALGAILYELLTGRPPFRGESAVDTLQQVVSQEPVAPTSLHAKVPRDLETICLRCLEKEPHKRYTSAEALADDLGRFIRGEPIHARPVGCVERLWRWCRRNPVPAALALGLFLALVLGFAGVVWQWREAVAQERETRLAKDETDTALQKADAERATAQKALGVAKTERAKAQITVDFFRKAVLAAPRPRAQGRSVTLIQALDEAVPKIGPWCAKSPEVEAAIRRALADTYYTLGEFAKAETQIRLALAIYRKTSPPGHRDTVMALNDLATTLQDQGKLGEAEPIYRKVIQDLRRLGGPDDDDRLTALHNLAALYNDQGKGDKALPIMREVSATCRRKFGRQSWQAIEADVSLVEGLRRQGKLAAAERLGARVLAASLRKLGPKHDLTMAATNNLANVYVDAGQFAKAEPLYRQVITRGPAVLGPEHPLLIAPQLGLARALFGQGKRAEAEKVSRRLLAMQRKILPANHYLTAFNLSQLGDILRRERRCKEAEPLLREALKIQRKVLPLGNLRTAGTACLLGDCLTALGRYSEAEPLLLEGQRVLADAAQVSAKHKQVAIQQIVQLYEAWGKPDKAAQWRKKLPPPSGVDTSVKGKK
jgi:tetratricopeptide (TPR) repeat protein